jgi:hypothetical protein
MCRQSVLIGFAAAALLALGLPTAAAADVGAGVGASPIALASIAQPGDAYRLPALYVVNTGTVASSYSVRVQRLAPHAGRDVPAAWVHFERNDFTLEPKAWASVPITLVVPAAAARGNYGSDLLVGTTAPRRPGGGAVLGAQAATKLMFRVGDAKRGLPWPWPWWVYTAVGIILALVAGAAAQRHFGYRLHVERRK